MVMNIHDFVMAFTSFNTWLVGYVNNSTRSVSNPEIQPCLNSRSDRFRTGNHLEKSQVKCIRQFSSLENDINFVITTLISRGSDSCGLNWYQIRKTYFWGKNNLSLEMVLISIKYQYSLTPWTRSVWYAHPKSDAHLCILLKILYG